MTKAVQGSLWEKPKNPTIVVGFPGFGLVSTIATGFLIDHLKCELIGKFWFEEGAPTLAVHNCGLVNPISIHYNKEYNIAIIHSISPLVGLEWSAAEFVLDIANQLQAKEIITTEGVGNQNPTETKGYFYSEDTTIRKKFEKLGIDCLGEGIIVGVASALVLKAPAAKQKITALFAETHSNLPDAKAAAKIIELLDQYLGLKVDYKPLLAQAEEFEGKLRSILTQQEQAKGMKEKKNIRYVG